MSSAGLSTPGRLIWVIVLLLLPALRVVAQAQPEVDRWVPALGVYSSLNLQQIENLAESPQRVRKDGDEFKNYVSMEGHLELMSPALFDDFGHPRLFVRAGAGRSWDSRHLTAENKPGRPVVNLLPNGGQPPLPGVTGQGTGIRTQFSPYFYTASAGLVFTIPLEERALRLKPSVEFRYGSFEIEGIVSHAISIADDGNCPCETGRLVSNEEKDHTMLGAGLELELDTQRAGPVMISLFAGSQAYRVLSGRKLKTAASGFLDDGTTPLDLRARSFLDEWAFNVGVGLRLRWLPEQ